MAKHSKTILRGGLQLAVMANIIPANPVRDVQPLRVKTPAKGAVALSADQLRALLTEIRASDFCERRDLVYPITILIATGLRRSELSAMRWSDFDADAGTLTVAGRLVRATGYGLQRIGQTKSAVGMRTLSSPSFAVGVLKARRGREYVSEQTMIFPSTAGTWRDPNNFAKQWRSVREHLGAPEITSHSFRKTVATLIDDSGLSARIGADQLGHAKVSMTQDRYMTRGKLHVVVTDLLDRTINDE